MSSTASTLERISDVLAQGVADVLTADNATLKIKAYGPRTTESLALARAEVRAFGFNMRASDQMNRNPSGDWYYNHRRGTVQITVITQRQAQSAVGADSLHGLAVGRIGFLMSRMAQRLVPAAVGGLQIVDIIGQAESYTSDEATDTGRTQIPFLIELLIPSTNYVDS